jgi:type VI secretion system protein ImpH
MLNEPVPPPAAASKAMAKAAEKSPSRPSGPGEVLAREPYRFDFFQAIRLLATLQPERRALGGDALPADEICRLRSHATNAFPPSQLQSFRPADATDRPPELMVNFFGLIGPMGALPRPYTDVVIERRMRYRDRTLHEFLDLFSHRLLSFFYRAWEKYRSWIGYEAAESIARQRKAESEAARRAFVLAERPKLDRVSQVLLEVAGLGEPGLRYRLRERDRLAPRTAIRDETFRFFSGLLAQQHRSAAGLEAILSTQFNSQVRVRQLCGRWLVLDECELSQMGVAGRSELGKTVVVGKKVWDAQGKFRVIVGPLTYAAFADLLPEGGANRPMVELTRLYAGPELDFDLELRLKPEEVPECRPGRSAAITPRLGWNTWLRAKPYQGEAVVTLVPREEV